jgi:hypothetical protein
MYDVIKVEGKVVELLLTSSFIIIIVASDLMPEYVLLHVSNEWVLDGEK